MPTKTTTTKADDSSTTDDTAPPPAAVAPRPRVSPMTNAYGFNQAVQWLAQVATQANNLADLQSFLADLSESTQKVVDTIDEAERLTLGRIAAGVPKVGQAGAA